MSDKKVKRTRKTSHLSMSDHIRKHSPIKKGIVIVKDEDKPLAKYNKIIDRIYLGNIQAAKDKDFFKDKKIKAVLNCTKDIPNYFKCQKDPEIEYMRIPIDDSLKEIDFQKAYEFMPAAVEFIYKHAVLQKENVFVHCFAGRQRSHAMIVAFLMKKLNMSPKKASLFVMEKRPEVMHYGLSYNFEDSVLKYYKDIQKHYKK